MTKLTHLDDQGAAHMVDVSHKERTVRQATARGTLELPESVRAQLLDGNLPKGDALSVARLAAIGGSKKTADLIPLCHPLLIDQIAVEFEPVSTGIRIQVTVRCTGRTGVEMEAMTGCSVGLLALYDMVKGVAREARIGAIELTQKEGGKSGTWQRSITDKD